MIVATGLAATNTPVPTDDSITVPVTDFPADFTTVDDFEVTVDAVFPNDSDISVELIPPTGSTESDGFTPLQPIILLASNVNAAGQTTNQGVTGGANLGTLVYPSATPNPTQPYWIQNVGTTFDDQAQRQINDMASPAPFIGHFNPSGSLFGGGGGFGNGGDLSEVFGDTPAQLTGTDGVWTLEITNYLVTSGNPPPVAVLTGFAMHFDSEIMTSGFNGSGSFFSLQNGSAESFGVQSQPLVNPLTNKPFVVPTGVAGNTYPQTTSASAAAGFGPDIVGAVDNSLGSFSPFQGQIYLAYTGIPDPKGVTGQNVFVITSIDDGMTWSAPIQVNDNQTPFVANSPPFVTANGEAGVDGPEFLPSIAVDQTTGTVVVDYYDTRLDPSNMRVANALSTSIDGGADWSQSTFINEMSVASDAITGATVDIEPIPGNQTLAGAQGFGDRAGLVVFDGHIIPAFATNLDAAGVSVGTATITIANGPVVLSADMGQVSNDFTYQPTVPSSAPDSLVAYPAITYNDTFTADGTRQFSSFVLSFDEPVDPSSFFADGLGSAVTGVQVFYQDTKGDAPIAVPVANVIPLDPSTLFGTNLVGGIVNGVVQLATQFQIVLATPQYAVGSYSYEVGQGVSDRIRWVPVGPPAVLQSEERNGPLTTGGPTSTATGSVLTTIAGTAGVNEVQTLSFTNPKNGQAFTLSYTAPGGGSPSRPRGRSCTPAWATRRPSASRRRSTRCSASAPWRSSTVRGTTTPSRSRARWATRSRTP